MRHSTRIILAASLAAGLVAAVVPQPASAFDSAQQKCRSTVAKSGGKYAKTVLKTMTTCHKNRDKNGGGPDCNDITAADTKGKVPAAETKFGASVTAKCTTGTPGDVLYDSCPAPCSGPITTFADVAPCEICLTRDNTETLSSEVNGTPSPAPITDEDVAACHKSILKNGPKLYNSVVKTVSKCQKDAEKGGSESVTGCTDTDFLTLVNEAYGKCETAIQDDCGTLTLPNAALDACGGTPSTLFELTVCVCADTRDAAQQVVTDYLTLSGPTTTTTTTTSTTNTTTTTLGGGGGQDPKCPDSGEVTLFSKLSNQTCATNSDCTSPRFCDPTLLLCTTVADLDSGWNGAGHDSDIDDGVTARAHLLCEGPASPGCGTCDVTGLDSDAGNCRCNNNILNKCDQPFATDNVNCTGSGSHTCDCYFGPPFPLAAQGTPVCVSNRFSQDITGTANPDAGSGQITASLRTKVHLGITKDMPCPVCGGKCSGDSTGCIFDSDCTSPQTCVQDVPGDGIRNGKCVYDPNTHVDNGVACDSDGTNASFPAILGAPAGNGGGGYSIDCQPTVGTNVSGQGLAIHLSQTTGTASLGFGVDCDGAGAGTALCPCLVCSADQSQPCSSNAECGALPGNCAGATSGGGVTCTANADCTSANIGPCQAGVLKCAKKNTQSCATNADCLAQNVAPCNLQTCTSSGAGTFPEPNFCLDDLCTDQGGGEGQCDAGPSFKYCDGLVRVDGTGISSCTNNADCAGGYGLCTLLDPADCFLDPIVATGVADPTEPVAAAVFCIPPTSNGGINSSAGLPGPGRITSQSTARTFCASNNAIQYNPGGLPACP